jgi:glutamate-5-semialdehyde dehydrogenase
VLQSLSLPEDLVQLISSQDRQSVTDLLKARGYVDLVIPRGSAALIEMVVSQAQVPTIETGAGICHIYIDQSADEAKALPIVVNAKVDRPSVCNAVETVLIHQDRLANLLPHLLADLKREKVFFHLDQSSAAIAREIGLSEADDFTIATEESWRSEYGTLEINIKVVSDIDQALDHIEKYGTHHTEAIITEDSKAAQYFVSHSDSAAIMINASTRFTDGQEMGFGAEIGISTQKLHARGPMGLAAMTTTTWIVSGTGQIR